MLFLEQFFAKLVLFKQRSLSEIHLNYSVNFSKSPVIGSHKDMILVFQIFSELIDYAHLFSIKKNFLQSPSPIDASMF